MVEMLRLVRDIFDFHKDFRYKEKYSLGGAATVDRIIS